MDLRKINYDMKISQDIEINFHKTLGENYFKDGNNALGLLHFEKAKALGAIDQKFDTQILEVKQKILSLNATAMPFWSESESYLSYIEDMRVMPKDVYITTALLISICLLIIINFTLKKSTAFKNLSIKKKQLYFAVILFFAFLFSLSPLIINHCYLSKQKFAVILKDTIVREGPSNIFEESENARVVAGTKVLLGKKYNGRYKVFAPKCFEGWIPVKDVGLY
ncbi:MAG: hypothetical protein HQK49_12580 [Oligoflexia bacterium]|nr:hypothetical protein [Oligoflexia bacterium]